MLCTIGRRLLFLIPTLLPAGWTLVFAGSALIGRPLTGVALHRLSGGPRDWRRHAPLRRVYTTTTWIAAGICFVNFALGAAGDGQARAAITVDQPLSEAQLKVLRATPGVLSLQQV